MFFGIQKINIFNKGNIFKNDSKLIDLAIKDIKNSTQPWFKFVFITSSHFNYHYPKSFEKFKPIASNTETFLLNKNIDSTPLINKYKNSLLYSDSLVGKLLLNIDLNNTIVIITADHAEEFNENKVGLWGHGSNYTIYQTQVPFILYIPNIKPKQIDVRTSHIDLLPTILSYLGVKNRLKDYSNGLNLLEKLPKNRNLVFASYKDKAYLINNTIISVGLFTKKYNLYNISNESVKFSYKDLNILRNQEYYFFNK
jgi:membrane-anchored protein YejM (alkaline phosphatase superfamily)